VALDLVWGYCGVLSLGHGLFFALGGYAMGMYLMRQIGRDEDRPAGAREERGARRRVGARHGEGEVGQRVHGVEVTRPPHGP